MYYDDDPDPGIWITYAEVLYAILVGAALLTIMVIGAHMTIDILKWITPGAVDLH